jgi:hypothetical protein
MSKVGRHVDNSLTDNRSSGLLVNPQETDETSEKRMLVLERRWSVQIETMFERTSQVRKTSKEIVKSNARHTRQSIVLDVCRENSAK